MANTSSDLTSQGDRIHILGGSDVNDDGDGDDDGDSDDDGANNDDGDNDNDGDYGNNANSINSDNNDNGNDGDDSGDDGNDGSDDGDDSDNGSSYKRISGGKRKRGNEDEEEELSEYEQQRAKRIVRNQEELFRLGLWTPIGQRSGRGKGKRKERTKWEDKDHRRGERYSLRIASSLAPSPPLFREPVVVPSSSPPQDRSRELVDVDETLFSGVHPTELSRSSGAVTVAEYVELLHRRSEELYKIISRKDRVENKVFLGASKLRSSIRTLLSKIAREYRCSGNRMTVQSQEFPREKVDNSLPIVEGEVTVLQLPDADHDRDYMFLEHAVKTLVGKKSRQRHLHSDEIKTIHHRSLRNAENSKKLVGVTLTAKSSIKDDNVANYNQFEGFAHNVAGSILVHCLDDLTGIKESCDFVFTCVDEFWSLIREVSETIENIFVCTTHLSVML